MLPFRFVALLAFLAVASAQQAVKPTPVPILKQINRHNEDGSYTYGYEGADGSFKIETKLPTGEVKGKYGYVDDTGKLRVVEYGATKYGFEPSGEGITVAPPTLVDETTNKDGTLNPEFAPESYYEPAPQPAPLRPQASIKPRPQLQLENFPQQPQPQQQYQPAPRPAQVPQRSAIANAVQNFDYVPQTRPPAARAPQPSFSFAQPAPIQEEQEPAPRPLPKITYAQPAPRPAPSSFRFADAQPAPISRPQPIARPQPQPQPQQQYAPAPVPQSRPVQQYAPAPQQRPSNVRGGILDQLSKDYALPSGGAAPLHDISFGYY